MKMNEERKCETCRFSDSSIETEPCKICLDNEHVGISRSEWAPCPIIGDVVFHGMSSEQIRVYMAERGWMSTDKLSTDGWGNRIGFMIWFDRWDWHGFKLGKKVSISGMSADLSDMHNLVAKTAQRALDAWETFPDSVPYQTESGWIVPNAESLQPPDAKEKAKFNLLTSQADRDNFDQVAFAFAKDAIKAVPGINNDWLIEYFLDGLTEDDAAKQAIETKYAQFRAGIAVDDEEEAHARFTMAICSSLWQE